MSDKRVLVVGTGARRHAIVHRLLNEGCRDLWIFPSSPALESLPIREVPIGTNSLPALVDWAKGRAIDLAIVLDEVFLFRGISDRFSQADIACVGPSRSAALIERSKIFAKEVMRCAGVATPPWRSYDCTRAAWDACSRLQYPAVVKSVVSDCRNCVFVVDCADDFRKALKILDEQQLNATPVLTESFIRGPEFSLTVLADKSGNMVLFPLVHDYKRLTADEKSPMTSGMGAFAPVLVDERTLYPVLDGLERVLAELRRRNRAYSGLLTTNVILGPSGPVLLEFNTHFGDPETQTVLPLIDGSLLEFFCKAAFGSLSGFVNLHESAHKSSVSINLVRYGYPGSSYSEVIIPTEYTTEPNVLFYEAVRVDGGLAPVGGRVLSCVASAFDFQDALSDACSMADRIARQVPGLTHREDIVRVRDYEVEFRTLTP